MNKALLNLQTGRAFLSDPKRWITGSTPQDEENNPVVNVYDPKVCKCCSLVALWRANYSNFGRTLRDECFNVPGYQFLNQAVLEMGGEDENVGGFNDRNEYAKVMRMWDRAIELAFLVA